MVVEANAHRISPRVFANLFKTPHRWPLLLAESDGNSPLQTSLKLVFAPPLQGVLNESRRL